MGLFDVIRYPVNDIFSEEINSYPLEIMIPWMKECYKFVNVEVDSSRWKEGALFSVFVHLIIIRSKLDSLEHDADNRAYMLKDHFTQDLRRRIREHDEM